MRLLFITSNRIGDAILSTGILNYLSQAYPHSKITVAAGPLAAPLFQEVPNLEKIISFEKKSYGKHWFMLWGKTLFKKWDMVVDVRGSLVSYFLWTGKRYVWSAQKEKAGHRAEALAALLNLKVIPNPKIWVTAQHQHQIQQLMGISQEGKKRVKNLKKNVEEKKTLIALGMGANWRGKIWRIENFIALVKKMKADQELFPNCRFVLLGGPDERHLIDAFLKEFKKEEIIDLMGKVDLLMAFAALKNVDMFIGNDSGLMHLAAAAEIPTVGLFGPSRIEHYRPWGEKSTYVTTDLSYEELIAGPGYDPKTTDTLMDSLSVEKVFRTLKNLRQKFSKEFS
ncbi:MAG: glycosyltransferase family 9 protein [Proteobacteria bacterium]|nr:glycosyltransferase family 9 protein [Pseudomonadota bacterium]